MRRPEMTPACFPWDGAAACSSKISVGDTADAELPLDSQAHVSLYQKAVQTGLPFPKTRQDRL